MIDAVFISDLHLSPDDTAIEQRFSQFVTWAQNTVKNVYILGDFFHAWAGDDAINDWSRNIAAQLRLLSDQGVNLFYMHGNRDFLLGQSFARLAGWKIIFEPMPIQLGQDKVLLAHGDSFCTKDSAHQRFRKLTRNKLFPLIFLRLSLTYREQLVNKVRKMSQNNNTKSMEQMDVVANAVIKQILSQKTSILIHGHTHKPGITHYESKKGKLTRYTLSDWDDTPKLLCYDSTKGIYFTQI